MENLKVMVILTVFVTGIAYSKGVPCNEPDTFWKCNYHISKGWKHVQYECKKSYVRSSCPVMCNDCYGPKKTTEMPTTTATTSTITTTTPTSTTSTTTTTKEPTIKCPREYAFCRYLSKYHCRSYAHFCPRKCNLCNGDKKTTVQPHTTSSTMIPTTTTTSTTTTKKQTTTTTMEPITIATSTMKPTTTTTTIKPTKITTTKTMKPTTKSTTMKPTTTTTTTTTMQPTTTSTVTMKPTTTTTTTDSTTTTKIIIIITDPPNGVCADRRPYCLMKSIFNPKQDCGKHSSVCIKTCGACSGPENKKCDNLRDRALNCVNRDCQASNMLERHRTHINCANTCCRRGHL